MQELINEEKIVETKGFQSIAYILNDEKLFVMSNYKIIQGMEDKGIIRCNKIRQNGRIKLVYSIGEMKTLDVFSCYMHYPELVKILSKIIDIILDVEANGFINLFNLDCRAEHIYIDNETFSPHMIYLPLLVSYNNGNTGAKIRGDLVKIIRGVSSISLEERNELLGYLEDNSLDFEQLKKIISRNASRTSVFSSNILEEAKKYAESQSVCGIKLKSVNGVQGDLDVNTAEYIIGKQAGVVDGLIANVAVSRKHCVITNIDGKHYIEDLDSTNGTKVNDVRIPSHKKTEINPGDIIKIADIKFQVEI